MSESARSAEAVAWERAASAEHASVAAFAQLAKDLVEAGAAPELVSRCLEAGLEEIRHAQDAFAIASAYAGEPRGPLPQTGSAALARLAAEGIVDGCLNEGRATAVALEQLERATDPAIRAALARVAADEARHAVLAGDVVRFSLARGGVLARLAAGAAFAGATRGGRVDAGLAARTRALLDGSSSPANEGRTGERQ